MLLLWNDMACRVVTNKINFQVFHLAFGCITGHGGREGHKPRLQCGKMPGNQGHSTMFRLTGFGETKTPHHTVIQTDFTLHYMTKQKILNETLLQSSYIHAWK